ncbi:chromate transporter [Anaerosphaera multitolerans]|uniref:Chromate transporter n=1 Tax=Anaerosphaera multitolerans TaxID=2487351 RepID=A0A437S9Y1_9FIRM|nr:chromate transporter [Anaerosphaera multitolerans]RVU55691.1 chromate transporter [Anaerosphaera multitolerans]
MIFKLFITFFKIGSFSIGGGYAIMPLIQEQVVNQHQWITEKTFTDIITISQMTPGPLVVNSSTFVGMQISGPVGAVVATFGSIIGGITIAILLHEFFSKYRSSQYVFQVLNSLKASSLGLIMSAGFTMLLLAFFNNSDFRTISSIKNIDLIAVLISAISLFILRRFKINPIIVMVVTGVVGLFVYV